MSEKITFNELKAELAARAGQPGMPPAAQSGNAQSALKSFWVERGLDGNDIVGTALRAEYASLREAHMAATKAGRNRRWLLNFAAHLISVLDYESALAANAPTRLQEALRALFAEGGRKITATAREIGVSPQTLKGWIAKQLPRRHCLQALPRLEELCKLEPGALTDLLPYRAPTRREMAAAAKELPPDEFLERSSERRKDRYYLKIADMAELPVLRAQWEALLADMVRGAMPGKAVEVIWTAEMVHELANTSAKALENSWRLRELRDGEAPRWFDCVGKNRVPCGDMSFDKVRMLLGWASRSREAGGAGLPKESLSLAMFADANLVTQFFGWHVGAHKRPTRTHTNFLQMVLGQLSAGRGYVARTWSLGASVGIGNEAAWIAHCAAAHSKILDLRKKFKKKVRFSRSTKEALRTILGLADPIGAVVRGVKRMEKDPKTGKLAAGHVRDLLLITLAMSNPLRAANFSAMTYQKGNTGELRKMPDGAWRILIDRSKMKNINGAAKDRDYDQPVEPQVWPYIEAYLRVRDQFNPSRYLFAPALNRSTKQYLGEQALSDRFRVLLQQYVIELPRGAGIHAIRDIRATHEIVTTGDYVHAAYLLHDTEKTTREHYIHVLNAYHERQRALRGTTSALGGLSGRTAA